MAHRKILEITLKVVIDIDNDDLPERQASPDYQAAIEGRIEEFIDETIPSLTATDTVSVHSAVIESYNVTL